MSWHCRRACLLLALALLVVSPARGGPAGGDQPTGTDGPPSPADAGPQRPTLPPPQWVGGTDTRGTARLIWIGNPAFEFVRVFRRDEGAATPFRLIGETRENVWMDANVQPGRAYRYRLIGVAPDGREGRPSAELAVRVGAVRLTPAAAPQWEGYLLIDDGVGLKWSAREGEDIIAWNVYRKTPPETEFRLIGSTQGTSYHDAAVEPDKLYVYVLTALDASFRETPFSRELPVKVTPPQAPAEPKRPAAVWLVRRTRLVGYVAGGRDLPFQRPADVVVGPVSGSVYVADSGRNLVFVFSPQGVFERTLGASQGGESAFSNLLGLATDGAENLITVDAGAGVVRSFTPQGRLGSTLQLPRPPGGATGLIDAAVGPDGRLYVVDNYNNQVSIVGHEETKAFGSAGAGGGEFSAPTFCAIDAAGNFVVADCLNARIQVFSGTGEFRRAFGRAERGPGGFGRPKGVAVSPAGEIYVADSWLNTVQVFDAEGRFLAVLGDESGRPLDLGSPNGVALGPENRVYIAERLSARLQIRELIDGP